MLYTSQECPPLQEGFFADFFFLVADPVASRRRPSFLKNISSQSHMSLYLQLALMQHMQPGLQISRFHPLFRSESSVILSTEQERKAGC